MLCSCHIWPYISPPHTKRVSGSRSARKEPRQAHFTLALRLRTRLTVAKPGLTFPPPTFDQKDRQRSSPTGRRNHPATVRPSEGNAARSVAPCERTLRRFMTLSETITHTATFEGTQPRSRATFAASRRFRSTVPMSSLTSTMSVFSSITSIVRVAGCQARMSMTPRSPRMANDSSGTRTQPSRRLKCRATA